MKKIILFKLKFLSRLIIKKYQPEIIGITGSVGKTSTREAVFCVLSKKYKVRSSIKNYNNEIGLPLTIIGVESPGFSIIGWIKVFYKAILLIIKKDENYPLKLILEMGVDRPGDMDYLNKIVKCQIGIVTMVSSSHLEYFDTVNKIKKEKGKLIENLGKDGWAILNYDNKEARSIAQVSRSKVLTYGLLEKSDVRAQEIVFSFERDENSNSLQGLSFKLTYNGSFVPVFLPQVIGFNAVYSALAAACVGISYGMNLVEISEALRDFKSPQGRMNLISGIKDTMIIDDTYNSSPASLESALEVIKRIPMKKGFRKIAVLGDMLELGKQSESSHKKVAKLLVESGIKQLFLVGPRSLDIAVGAKNVGMKESEIFHFDNSQEAGRFVQDRIKKGDLIFVKGSQGMRMEKVVLEIMAEPMRAKDLLVRQGGQWSMK